MSDPTLRASVSRESGEITLSVRDTRHRRGFSLTLRERAFRGLAAACVVAAGDDERDLSGDIEIHVAGDLEITQ